MSTSLPDEAVAERLKQARINAGFETAAAAAAAFGWSPDTYKSHENGIRGLKQPVAKRYAQAFRVRVAWLLTGEEKSPLPSQSEVYAIALIGVAAAGVFRQADWLPEDDAVIPAIPRQGIPVASQYAVRVDGPSVNKRIPDGAYAVCARYEAYHGGPEHGKLVHVQRTRAGLVETTIKEIRYERGGAIALWPCSDHKDHQEPIRIDSSEMDAEVQIIGVVIGSFSPM